MGEKEGRIIPSPTCLVEASSHCMTFTQFTAVNSLNVQRKLKAQPPTATLQAI
ncbi:MAG: hypothetical protein ACTSUS_02470 [Candidatus Freyarchaeota archaeon]